MTTGLLLRETIQREYTMEEAAALLEMTRPTLYNKTKGDLDEDFLQLVKIKLPKIAVGLESILEETKEMYGNKKFLTMQDIANMVRRNEAVAEVTLAATAEMLAILNGVDPEGVRKELQARVNERLKGSSKQ